MKRFFLLACIGLFMLPGHAQFQDYSNGFDAQQYEDAIMPSQWELEFKNAEDREDFRKLRIFLMNRNDLLSQLNEVLNRYAVDPNTKTRMEGYLEEIQRIVGKDTNNLRKRVDISGQLLNAYYQYIDMGGAPGSSYNPYGPSDQLSIDELLDMRKFYKRELRNMQKQDTIRERIKKNIMIVKDDIGKCNNQLDLTLAPSIREQQFRITVSICFSALIGILLVIFFAIIYKRSGNDLSKELLSSNGLQFITLFVLIIAIILFGILNVLHGSELAAILSGISGYILGKGVGGNSGSGQNPPPPPAPPETPAPPASA